MCWHATRITAATHVIWMLPADVARGCDRGARELADAIASPAPADPSQTGRSRTIRAGRAGGRHACADGRRDHRAPPGGRRAAGGDGRHDHRDRHVDAVVRGAGLSRAGHDQLGTHDVHRATASPSSNSATSASTASSYAGTAVPRLPIIEPERVASPPLAITLTDVYRYQLDGRETIARRSSATSSSFEPDPDDRGQDVDALPRQGVDCRGHVRHAQGGGHADAPAGTDRRVRTGRRIPRGRPGVWLLARSDVRQMYEGAAHRTPDPPCAGDRSRRGQRRRISSRGGSRPMAPATIMLRDTPEGYRYLKKAATRPRAGSRQRLPAEPIGCERLSAA